MLVHELVNNAARHGAISSPQGVVEFTWKYDSTRALLVTWQEVDGPTVASSPEVGLAVMPVRGLVEFGLG